MKLAMNGQLFSFLSRIASLDSLQLKKCIKHFILSLASIVVLFFLDNEFEWMKLKFKSKCSSTIWQRFAATRFEAFVSNYKNLFHSSVVMLDQKENLSMKVSSK